MDMNNEDEVIEQTANNAFRKLDPVLHAQLRLAIMSLLMRLSGAEFSLIREKTGATPGNLSTQLNKLRDAGYITINKTFKKNYPQTICRITAKGEEAFESYSESIHYYLHPRITPQ